jgi:hypothetical protein
VPGVAWVATDPQCRSIDGNSRANELLEPALGEKLSASAPMQTRPFFAPDGRALSAAVLKAGDTLVRRYQTEGRRQQGKGISGNRGVRRKHEVEPVYVASSEPADGVGKEVEPKWRMAPMPLSLCMIWPVIETLAWQRRKPGASARSSAAPMRCGGWRSAAYRHGPALQRAA